MDDRVTRLERLARLRESGTLTDAEFEAEKARILADEALGEDVAIEEPRSGWAGRILLGGGIAIGAAAALWLAWPSIHPTAPAPEAVANVAMPEPLPQAPPMSDTQQQAAAFAVAFDSASPFKPEKIVPVGGHLAVIAVAGNPDGAHVESGTLAVQYVDRNGDGFTRVGPRIEEQAGSFGQIGGWSLRRDLADDPVVVLEGGGTWQGCTVSGAILIALAPDAPHTLTDFIPTGFEDDSQAENGPHYDGNLVRAGDAIAVRYTGSVTTTVTLRPDGAKLVPDRPLPDGC